LKSVVHFFRKARAAAQAVAAQAVAAQAVAAQAVAAQAVVEIETVVRDQPQPPLLQIKPANL